MMEKISFNLNNLQKTLLLPLWARALESQKDNPLLMDKKAIEIIDKIDYNLSDWEKNLKQLSYLGWIIRAILTDRKIKEYLKVFPHATVVNVGCGLDTSFNRNDNNKVIWYDLDFPDVITLRKTLICETDRNKYIACSFLEFDKWMDYIDKKENVLFVAAGVLYYLTDSEINTAFKTLVHYFHKSEMVFDATSPFGVKAANKMVIKNSGMDENSFLKWGLKNASDLKKMDSRLEILDEQLFFKETKKGLDSKNKRMASLSDKLKFQYLVHVRF